MDPVDYELTALQLSSGIQVDEVIQVVAGCAICRYTLRHAAAVIGQVVHLCILPACMPVVKRPDPQSMMRRSVACKQAKAVVSA